MIDIYVFFFFIKSYFGDVYLLFFFFYVMNVIFLLLCLVWVCLISVINYSLLLNVENGMGKLLFYCGIRCNFLCCFFLVGFKNFFNF